MTHFLKRIGYLSLLLATGCFLQFTPARALDTNFEVSFGYDDNPAEVDVKDGSGFTRYRVLLGQSVFKDEKGPDVNAFLDAAYGQYFSLDDNYWLRAGATFDAASWFDRIRPGIFAEVAAYRDELVPDDERDELMLGGVLQWFADARLTLSLRQVFTWADYRNRVSLPGQRIYFVGKRKGHGGHQQIPVNELVTYSREDDIWSTEMTAICYFTADLQADLSFQYRDVASSDNFESFQAYGASTRIGWLYSRTLEIFLTGFWSGLDYNDAPQNIDRKDDIYGFGIGANRSMGKMTLFLQFNQTVNDSPVNGEDYEKAVAQCGVVYSF